MHALGLLPRRGGHTVDRGAETLMYEVGWQYTHGGYDGFAQPGGPVWPGVILSFDRNGSNVQ